MLTRSQFEDYLKNTFNFIMMSGGICFVLQAILSNDQQMLAVINSSLNDCSTLINSYLDQYDAAQNDEQRMAVISSVVPM